MTINSQYDMLMVLLAVWKYEKVRCYHESEPDSDVMLDNRVRGAS